MKMIARRTLIVGALCAAVPARAAPQDIARALLAATNSARAGKGLPPVSWNQRLARAGQQQAKAMLQSSNLSHTAGGTGLTARARHVGYRYGRITENIAWLSRRSATEAEIAGAIHSMWMNSAGHRQNILDRRVTEIGIGVARSGSSTYAAQVFGRPI